MAAAVAQQLRFVGCAIASTSSQLIVKLSLKSARAQADRAAAAGIGALLIHHQVHEVVPVPQVAGAVVVGMGVGFLVPLDVGASTGMP